MRAASEYAFLHARVSTLAAQLQPPATLEPLIDEPDADHTGYFAAAGLAALFEQPPADARELEQTLAGILVGEAVRLGRGLNPAARELIHHFVRRFEMVNLKILIRCKIAGCGADEIRERLFDLGDLPGSDGEALLQAEDLNECLRLLETGRHAMLGRQLRQVLGESHEVFLVEAAIDYGYFSTLVRLVNALPFNDRQSVHPFIAHVIDQINLVWLMRYRLGYGMTPPHAYFLLVRTGGQLDRARLAALAQLDTLDAMLEALPPAIAGVLQGAASVSEVEDRFNLLRERQAANVLHHSTFNLARALAYLLLREHQMRTVHAVLKGRTLRLPADLIRRAVGGATGQEAA